MAVDVDKLKDGLSNYNDSLNEHLGHLQTDLGLLQNSYNQFANDYEGRGADEFKIAWEQTMHWFEDYLSSTRNLSIILDERLNSLRDIASTGNATTWTKAASQRPENKSVFKKDLNSLINQDLIPNHSYKIDGYEYKTDEHSEITGISGCLSFKSRGRNVGVQIEAKTEKEGRYYDQGGHLIAQMFNGPVEKINIVPMSQYLNQKDWKNMENDWKEALAKGKKVVVDIQILYNNSKRPDAFEVNYWIDNAKYSCSFSNKQPLFSKLKILKNLFIKRLLKSL